MSVDATSSTSGQDAVFEAPIAAEDVIDSPQQGRAGIVSGRRFCAPVKGNPSAQTRLKRR